MKTIKSVTFEAVHNLANEISVKNKSINYDAIVVKINNYLFTDGNKNFIETYNELATTKNFDKAVQILKI
jgi:hypothetical protein